jgi:hypothetical protein
MWSKASTRLTPLHNYSASYQSPNSFRILSLTSLNPPTLLTRPGLAGPASSPIPNLLLAFGLGLVGPPEPVNAGRTSLSLSLLALYIDPGEAATSTGISSHSCLPTTLVVRKNGHSSVNIPRDVSASEREIGVSDDLTITSATSESGIVRRRALGGVVSELEEVLAAENILQVRHVIMQTGRAENSHPNTLGDTLEPAQSTATLELFLLSGSRHVEPEPILHRRA